MDARLREDHPAHTATTSSTAADSYALGYPPVYGYLADVVRSLLPMAERHGVATAAEVAVDGLAERLRAEAVVNNACIMLPPLVGAWTRTRAPTTDAAGGRALIPMEAMP
jgi:hypothetical protein